MHQWMQYWWLTVEESRWSGLGPLLWVKFLWRPDILCRLALSWKGIPSAPNAAYLCFGFASHPDMWAFSRISCLFAFLSAYLVLLVFCLAHSLSSVVDYMFSHTSHLPATTQVFVYSWVETLFIYLNAILAAHFFFFSVQTYVMNISMFICISVVCHTISVCF